MINYLKSECYRILHYKWTYLFILICSALLVSMNVLLSIVKLNDANFPYATTQFAFSFVYGSMLVIFLLCMAVSGFIFGNEYSNHTMKNSISYGITRGTVFIGKLLVQILYSIVAFSIIIGIFVASSYLLLKHSDVNYLFTLLETSFICLPLFLSALAVTNCFLFVIENNGGATAACCGIMLFLPLVSNLLGMKFMIFKNLSKVLPYNMINAISFQQNKIQLLWSGTQGICNYWIIGIAELIMFTLLGYILIYKKEIK
jgi:hypothetical protein